jgi:hypothetical protein
VSRLLRLKLAAIAFGVLGASTPPSVAASDCPKEGAAPTSPAATALMGALEQNFRRGVRVVRMDIRTHYTRVPSAHHAEAYQPNQRTLWGVFEGDPEETRLLYVFSGPGRLAGTTLLLRDRVATNEPDAMWLYLRAFDLFKKLEAGKEQVLVPGTALTYEDSRGFIPLDKYLFSDVDDAPSPPSEGTWILGCPRSGEVREQLGYGSLRLRVDPEKQIVLAIEYKDVRGKPLKTYTLVRGERVGDLFFPVEVLLEHEADGFSTQITYEYWLPDAPPPSSLFEASTETGPFIDRLEAYVARIGQGSRIRAELEEADAAVEAFFEKLRGIQEAERQGKRFRE